MDVCGVGAGDDPAGRALLLLPGGAVCGVGAASSSCCSAPGWCQPASHRWQLEVSRWPTARRLLQGLDVVLEKQNVRGWVR